MTGSRGLGRIVTGREIAELACAAVGRPPRLRVVAPGVVRFAAGPVTLRSPRLGHILRFYAAVSTRDCVAPESGSRTLEEYLRSRVGDSSAA